MIRLPARRTEVKYEWEAGYTIVCTQPPGLASEWLKRWVDREQLKVQVYQHWARRWRAVPVYVRGIDSGPFGQFRIILSARESVNAGLVA